MAERKKQTLPKSIKALEFIGLIKVIPKKDIIAKTSFLLSYGAGLRLSEVLNLMPEDVTTHLFISQGKNSKDRIAPLPKGFKPYMKDLLPLKDKTTARTLERKFKKYALQAGLDSRYTFHSLRHGFAIRCLESGIPINQVQNLLGHSNVATTNIYIKANPKDALDSYEELF